MIDPDESVACHSSEETIRLKRLRRLAADPDALYKPHRVADAALISRLEALRVTAPNACAVVDILIGAARVSAATGAPLDVPPLLLVGPPGCGKTRLVREIQRALNVPALMLVGSSMPDASAILGTAVGWRGAAPGRMADLLLKAPTSCPLVFLDEIEKMRLWDRKIHAADLLLGLLDRDMARTFEDAHDRVPLRADKIIWIAAANALDDLSEPVLDRFLIIEMQPPTQVERRIIVRRIYDDMRQRLGLDPATDLGDREVDLLTDIGLRRIGPAVQLALGRAMTAGRGLISADDLAWALAAVERGRTPERRRIGF